MVRERIYLTCPACGRTKMGVFNDLNLAFKWQHEFVESHNVLGCDIDTWTVLSEVREE